MYKAISSDELDQVRKDPQVQKIMTLFGGDVIDVRRDQITEESDEDNFEGDELNEDYNFGDGALNSD